MVRLDDVPETQARIELNDLMKFMIAHGGRVPFIAVGEGWATETSDKTGGLKINLWTGSNFVSRFDINKHEQTTVPITYEEGLQLTQKYSKISGNELRKAMEKLGINDTELLSEKFYEYELFPMRTGFPRLIPVSVSDKVPETLPEQ